MVQPDGTPVVAWLQSPGVAIAHWTGSGWSTPAVISGGGSSVFGVDLAVLDRSGDGASPARGSARSTVRTAMVIGADGTRARSVRTIGLARIGAPTVRAAVTG